MFAKTASFVFRLFSLLMLLTALVGSVDVTPAYAVGILYATPNGTGDCSSWANACALHTALTDAVSGDEIWVAAGTYNPTTGTDRAATFQLKDGVAVYGGFDGTETAREQRNWTTNVTVLSGNIGIVGEGCWDEGSDNSYHVVTSSDTDASSVLNGFTITGGCANDIPHPVNGTGAGLYNSLGSPTLANLIFDQNTAGNVGGMLNAGGSPSLTNIIFKNNYSGHAGGGMSNGYGSPTLTNVVFSGNFANNYGGGMSNGYGNPILMNVTFTGNLSTLGGGGMYNEASSPILTNVTFSGNPSHQGGGMYNSNSSPTLTNVTFTGNVSTLGGGGMYEKSSDSILTNVTFRNNTAGDYGGGIFNLSNSNPQIRNTIFWDNTAAVDGAQIYNDASSPVVSDSVIQDGCPAGSTCTNIITIDPMLGTVGNYGGFTQTIPLLPGSSAIDALVNGTNDCGTTITTDQRGVTRSQRSGCDIGAYEYDYTGIYHVKPLASGTENCQNWNNACTLQNALTTAVSGDEIWAAGGVYKPTTGTDRTATFELKDGVGVYGGFVGTETARDQRDFTTIVTILSGDLNGDDVGFANNSENIYHVVTGADNTILDGFTITAGNATGVYPNDIGGGMINYYRSPMLTNVTFNDNSAYDGGGMYNYKSNSILMNVIFNGNSAGYGGGMYNNSSSPTLANVTFSGNSGITEGGGIINFAGSDPTLMNVTFSGNTAYLGGGMANMLSSSPTLTNVTFSGNSADRGGGMENYLDNSPILTNVTFSGNSANMGGGIYNVNSSPTVRNTIFWGNAGQIYNYDTASSPVVSDSVMQNGCPTGITCTNIITTDPLLSPLGNYGGFTQTIPLLFGSSAIDTGNDTTCALTDQRGVKRPQGTHCDIGAYEAMFMPSPWIGGISVTSDKNIVAVGRPHIGS